MDIYIEAHIQKQTNQPMFDFESVDCFEDAFYLVLLNVF